MCLSFKSNLCKVTLNQPDENIFSLQVILVEIPFTFNTFPFFYETLMLGPKGNTVMESRYSRGDYLKQGVE